jgi:hypothetical protein
MYENNIIALNNREFFKSDMFILLCTYYIQQTMVKSDRNYTIKIHPATDKLVVLENPDKGFQESWSDPSDPDAPADQPRSLAAFPHSCQIYISAKVSSGKGILIQNIIMSHKNPPFACVKVVHPCASQTTEWNDICEEDDILDEIPPLNTWDPLVKNLLILDDCNVRGFTKEQHYILDRTMGFSSSHNNLTVIITSQSFCNLPVVYRNMCNVFIVNARTNNIDTLNTMIRKSAGNVPIDRVRKLIKSFDSPYDFLVIDGTSNSPAPIRKNLFQKVDIFDNDEDE